MAEEIQIDTLTELGVLPESAYAREFSHCLGEAIRGFALVEHHTNFLLSVLLPHYSIVEHVIQERIARRLDLAERLILARLGASPPHPAFEDKELSIPTVFALARSSFKERNRIAHNPYSVEHRTTESGRQVRAGISIRQRVDHGERHMIDLKELRVIQGNAANLNMEFTYIMVALTRSLPSEDRLPKTRQNHAAASQVSLRPSSNGTADEK